MHSIVFHFVLGAVKELRIPSQQGVQLSEKYTRILKENYKV